MGRFWQQLKALVYRNCLLKMRNKKETLQEIIYPLYFVGILAFIRAITTTVTDPPLPINGGRFNSTLLFSDSFVLGMSAGSIAVAPNSSEVAEIMTDAVNSLNNATNLPIHVQYTMFATEESMEEAYKANASLYPVGVVFDLEPPSLNYTLRLPYSRAASADTATVNQGGCRQGDGLDMINCQANSYLYTGFTALQAAIDTAFINRQTNMSNMALPNYLVEMMPKPSYSGGYPFGTIASIYFVLAFSPFVGILTTNLVAEKEKKIKEAMKIMGLNGLAFWVSWLVVYVVAITLVSVVAVGVSFAAKLFTRGSFVIYLIMFVLYGLTIVDIAFMLTPLFNKAKVAGAAASMATLLISVLVLPLSIVPGSIPASVQWALCLFSPVALATGINQAVVLETTVGTQFDNITTLPSNFPVLYPIIMLIVDTLLYLLLAFYLDNVIPGAYGQQQPWYFCLMPSFWSSGDGIPHGGTDDEQAGDDGNDDVERVSADLQNKRAIRIQNLLKVYKKKSGEVEEDVVAVNGISFDIYEDQITALLGHNGAGKTTLVNALTGLLPPNSGTATIFGHYVTKPNEMQSIRRMTGLCPQQNILFDKLTAREHLRFFAAVKGIPEELVNAETEKLLKEIDLERQADTHSVNLSGGQKRKLCVGIAMIGDPKVIFLDEPTSGMDPYSRRHIWTLLKRKRSGKVIVLTTHFMDEADILADRKAIISKGNLRCAGSSLFLKNRFGVGYHLGLVTTPNCDTTGVTQMIQGHIPEASLVRSHAQELSYTLPLHRVDRFAALFADLDKKDSSTDDLGIQSYGVSMTTLEEVFLKLRDDVNIEDSKSLNGKVPGTVMPASDEGVTEVNIQMAQAGPQEQYALFTHRELTKRRLKALFRVYLINNLRNKAAVFFRLVMPLVFLVIGVVLLKVIPSGDKDAGSPARLDLSPGLYLKGGTGALSSADSLLYQNSTGSNVDHLLANFESQGFSSVQGLLDNMTQNAPHKLALDVLSLNISTQTFETAFVALYNDSAIHSLPVLLNILSNAIFGLVLENNGSVSPGAVIRTATQPFPEVNPTLDFSASFGLLMLLGFTLVILPAGFAMDIVKDKEVKVRAQLRVSGVTSNMYWVSLFFFDAILFAIPAILTIVFIAALQVDSLSSPGAVLSLVLICLLYIPNQLLLTFCGSFLFDKFETCQTVWPIVTQLAAFVPYFAVWPIDLLAQKPNVASIIHHVFCIIDPGYTIFGGLYYIDRLYRSSAILGQPLTASDFFVWSSNIPITYVSLLLGCVPLFFLLRYLDVRSTGGDPADICRCGSQNSKKTHELHGYTNPSYNTFEPADPRPEDDDIAEERQRVNNLLSDSSNDKPPVVMLQNLTKIFPKDGGLNCLKKEEKYKTAVSQLTLAVESGEVFGLLGPNGAGKTTAMNVITADMAPSKGRVCVAGYDVLSSLSEAFQAMGYCPQADALWELVTLREHLEVFAAIRGMNDKDIKVICDHFIESLEVEEHAKKRSTALSGGTKRKLSFAMSMLGNTQVVLMDEPSTGMDPGAKRFLWNTISAAFKGSSRGAILTTHSMEEADALCSRVGIMVNGQLKCLGSTQHLKNKYGSGYILDVKVKEQGEDSNGELDASLEHLDNFVHDLFPDAAEAEVISNRVTYNIPNEDVKSLARVFTSLEEGKEKVGIEEYSFSQSSLEQVFLRFARLQEEDEGEEVLGLKAKSIKRQRSQSRQSQGEQSELVCQA